MTGNDKPLDITFAQLAFGDAEPKDLHIFFNLDKNTFRVFSCQQAARLKPRALQT